MAEHTNFTLTESIEENISIIQNLFIHDDTLILRRFKGQNNPDVEFCIFFINGMVNSDLINKNIIMPILYMEEFEFPLTLNFIQEKIVISNQVNIIENHESIIQHIVSGHALLLMNGSREALAIDCRGYITRPITEPEVERGLRGPREGFTESLDINLSLIRRKIQSNKLKFEYMVLGEQTNTKLCITYIEGIASNDILIKLKDKLSQISIDGLLDVKYIEEFIDDHPYSLFETTNVTEKPDIVVAKMLEGRIALVLDGSPVVMTLPYLFIESFQSADDYYLNYYYATIGRMVRVYGFISSISIPALYLALVTYHQEIIPTPLISSIYASRLGVPLPSVLELLGLLLVFEVLREAGARMPANIGQSLSIVGALVLGTAAVDAKFVSAPVVIVVGLSGITSLMIPSLTGVMIIIKLALTLLCAIYGIYGYILGMAFLALHLFKLKSFGIPFMSGFMVYKVQALKDTTVRAPWWYMKYRPKKLGKMNPKRGGGKINE